MPLVVPISQHTLTLTELQRKYPINSQNGQQVLKEWDQWEEEAPHGERGPRGDATERMRRALTSKARELDLSGLMITTLPRLPEFTTSLNVSGCASLRQLPSLERIVDLNLLGCASLGAADFRRAAQVLEQAGQYDAATYYANWAQTLEAEALTSTVLMPSIGTLPLSLSMLSTADQSTVSWGRAGFVHAGEDEL